MKSSIGSFTGCAPVRQQKNPEPPAPENAAPSLIPAAPVPKPEPFTDDDSPPGFKIRWHC